MCLCGVGGWEVVVVVLVTGQFYVLVLVVVMILRRAVCVSSVSLCSLVLQQLIAARILDQFDRWPLAVSLKRQEEKKEEKKGIWLEDGGTRIEENRIGYCQFV